jgi:hypothetical protein
MAAKNDPKIDENTRKELFAKVTSQTRKETTRTTFSLSGDCLEKMESMIVEHSFNYPQLFENAILLIGTVDWSKPDPKIPSQENRTETRRKTFAIPSNILLKLQKISDRHRISRDIIVEYLMERLQFYFEHLEDHETKAVNAAAPKVRSILEEIDELVSLLSEELGDSEHPLVNMLGIAAVYVMKADMGIDEFNAGKGWTEDY